MYRTSTREPQYKHSIYERDSRHVDSREVSEEYTSSSSSSSSEEDEESSGKSTEESEEEATESQESYSLHKRSEWSPASQLQWSYNKLEKNNRNNTNRYVGNSRVQRKQDKDTQKNLLSPFPSFLIPPIHRQVTGPPYYRYTVIPNARSSKEERNTLKNATKYFPKRNKNHRELEDEPRVINKDLDSKKRKIYQKTKLQEDEEYEPNDYSSRRVVKDSHHEGPEKCGQNFQNSKPETERLSKFLTPISKYIRRPKSSTPENTFDQQTMTNFSDRTLELENKEKSKPITASGVTPSERVSDIREAVLARNIGDGKSENKKGGELKEKLVYVVEEEGKEVTKLETDLFTLNEILAIKRDLLELSEFAKKLKKLKEMRKESENMKNKENKCQCKPAEELLKDVNRRIEVLEARQGELEKGNYRTEHKEDTETDSKNTNVTKKSSGLRSKATAVQSSAVTTTDPIFSKTKAYVTRPEGFTNNSDIVRELTNIKTQLQKLENTRITKEVVPEGNTRLTGKKNHGIAVFSSKTYIFTHENCDKGKTGEKIKREDKARNCVTHAERREQKKANVASWLKNIKVQQTETDVSMFLSADKLKRKKNELEVPIGNENTKCRNCVQTLKTKDSDNQGAGDDHFIKLLMNDSSISETSRYMEHKKCVMSPQGKLLTLMSDPNENVLHMCSACRLRPSLGSNQQKLSPRIICRSGSEESVTSAILAKQKVRKLKAQVPDKRCKGLILCPSQSKSLQELGLNSSFCKVENIALNTNVKNFENSESFGKVNKKKECKNEFTNHLEAYLMALKNNFKKRDPSGSSCGYSEFLASINLDTEENSASLESNGVQKSNAKNEIYAYMATTKTNLGVLDLQRRLEEKYKESKKKKEKKEKRKSELKEKSKPKKEKKCKEPTKEEKLKKKKKKSECKNSNYSDFRKNNYRDCLVYNEKNSTSECFEIPSKDNLKAYMKLQTERSKTNLDCEKSFYQSFALRNVFKNLGRYYPKISYFHLFPFSRGEVCDNKSEEQIKSRHSKTGTTDESEEQENEDEDENCNRTSDGSDALRSNSYDKDRYHFYHQISKSGDHKNCRCVQVYLQTQEQRGWSGLGPFRPLSEASRSCESVPISSEISRSRSDSIFPTEKSNIQCVGHVTEVCEGKKIICEIKQKDKKKRKRTKRNVCVCCKCGNSHKVKKKKRKKLKCVVECPVNDTPETQECSDSELLRTCSCCEKPPSGTIPLLSFFSNFRTVKPCGSKFISKHSKKLSEVRHLKVCSGVKSTFFTKLRNCLSMSRDRKSCSKKDLCNCMARLDNIENKLKKLEKKGKYKDSKKKEEKKREKEEKKERKREEKIEKKREKCLEKECKRKKKHERKKEKLEEKCKRKFRELEEKKKKKTKNCDEIGRKKEKKNEECCCPCPIESKNSCEDSCLSVVKDEKKKEVKRCKEEESKKCRTKCPCVKGKHDQKCTGAYYCTVEYLSSSITSKTSTKKTSEETKSKELLEQTNTKPKLPFLSSFWEELQNYKVTNNQYQIRNLMKMIPTNLVEPSTMFLSDSNKEKSKLREKKPNDFSRKSNKNRKRRKETKENR